MRARIAVLLGLTAGAAVQFAAPAVAQTPPAGKPEWVAAHDLKVRKGSETDWTRASKVGVEVFKDGAGNAVVAINAAGVLAVAPATAEPGKKAEWATAMSFSVRGASEGQFTAGTALYGVESFSGVLANHLLYVSDKGGLAFGPGAAAGPGKDPQFQYGLVLKVRKPGQNTFDANAKGFGIEAYKDNNSGGMLYITENGLIATAAAVPDKAPDVKEVKKPKPLHGLEAKVRRAEEAEFSEKTQKIGIEVFKDENTGTLLYVSESGSIAAVPPPAEVKTKQKLQWMHAMTLKARPGGEGDFTKAKKYGMEVFKDLHTGYTLYVTETGNIAVVATK